MLSKGILHAGWAAEDSASARSGSSKTGGIFEWQRLPGKNKYVRKLTCLGVIVIMLVA